MMMDPPNPQPTVETKNPTDAPETVSALDLGKCSQSGGGQDDPYSG
jgi:hypothetical protein